MSADEKVNLEDSKWEDIHVTTGALKMFFRELPEPLFTYTSFNDFVEAISEFFHFSVWTFFGSTCLIDSQTDVTRFHMSWKSLSSSEMITSVFVFVLVFLELLPFFNSSFHFII